jgi:hypothetical protein
MVKLWVAVDLAVIIKEGQMAGHLGLFDTVPTDHLHFGYGLHFNPKLVASTLEFNKEDVSRIAQVSVKSVRWDENIPSAVRDRFQEIASTINMVASAFDGNVDKTVAWFKTTNPLLGDVAPRDMIRLGRYERLRKFIINAMNERGTPTSIKADER